MKLREHSKNLTAERNSKIRTMIFVKGKPVKEIARKFRLSPSTIYSILYRLRKNT